MQSPLTFFFAFIVVLALIGLATWLVRRFAANRVGSSANRGRMPRLAVIDAAAVDSRRRLVLVRRDNVEHLLMIGGPSDIVVEPNIVRATPAREQMPPRAPVPPVVADQTWADTEPARPEQIDFEPAPETPQRTPRPAFAEEMRRPPPMSERRTDPLAGFSPEPPARAEQPLREPPLREPPQREGARTMTRADPLIPRPLRNDQPKAAPPVRPAERPAAPTAGVVSAADKNLAEMAQRLEAALRRPGGGEPRPAAEPRPTVDRVGAPPVAPDAPVDRNAPRPTISEPEAASADQEGKADEAPKTQFKNLEDEMASLLGRPKPPS